MIAIRLGEVSKRIPGPGQTAPHSPSRAGPSDHVEVVTGLGNLLETTRLLDLNHDLVQDEKGGHSSDTPAIWLLLAWTKLYSQQSIQTPTKGEEVDRFFIVAGWHWRRLSEMQV